MYDQNPKMQTKKRLVLGIQVATAAGLLTLWTGWPDYMCRCFHIYLDKCLPVTLFKYVFVCLICIFACVPVTLFRCFPFYRYCLCVYQLLVFLVICLYFPLFWPILMFTCLYIFTCLPVTCLLTFLFTNLLAYMFFYLLVYKFM